jgi:hypothetical protein
VRYIFQVDKLFLNFYVFLSMVLIMIILINNKYTQTKHMEIKFSVAVKTVLKYSSNSYLIIKNILKKITSKH